VFPLHFDAVGVGREDRATDLREQLAVFHLVEERQAAAPGRCRGGAVSVTGEEFFR
jgi:hypothetical protein